eukprot:TRINITY_DN131_c0_g1_i2.p5 TRINITY_DN131_c0_g1~~TRINITY_DN131_c0_g1_i2.p5  ORF type:complete len:129 (+),score=17.22 TRINITY_DN131_c0_g1_i2:1262-1648(+)
MLQFQSAQIEDLEDKFEKACELQTGVYVTFTNLKVKEIAMFTVLCKNKKRVQECSQPEQIATFGVPPSEEDMNFLGALEEAFDCAGLCGISLSKYMFSDTYSGKPTGTCDAKVSEFISGKILGNTRQK